MWKSRLIGEEDKEKYNSFIESSRKGHVMQTWQWGEVKRKTGWKPLYLVIENTETGEMEAAALLLKRTIPVIRKAFFYAPRGPVLDTSNRELFSFLLGEIRKLAVSKEAVFLKIDPDIEVNSEFEDTLNEEGFKSPGRGKNFEGIQPRFVIRLDITRPEEEILKGFHSKTRYNIRLAQKRGVEIKEDCEKSDLETFYEILKVTAVRDKFLIRSYSYYEALWTDLMEEGLAKLFMAYYDGKPVSGTIAFIFGDKAWYIYGASDNHHRQHMPNYLLQWEMIKWAKRKGCKIYDLRGISGDLSPDNPLYGLYRFKKGFNPEMVEFIGEYDLVYSGFYYYLWNNLAKPANNILRKLIQLKGKLISKKR